MKDNVNESKITILVVDDDPELLLLTCQFLEHRFGYDVLMSGTGQSAITTAAGLQPDVILMDLSMPGMGGDTVTRILKERYATQHIPVIAYSNNVGTEKWKNIAEKAGCVRCIEKMASHADVDRIIREVLEETRQSQG